MFRLLDGKPKVLISDEQASIKSALDLLRYENIWDGEHLLDSFHVLKNIKKRLSKKSHISYFKQIIQSQNQNSFEFCVKSAENNLNEN